MASTYVYECKKMIQHHELRIVKLGRWLFRWTPFTPIARILIERHQKFADLLSDVRWTEESLAIRGESCDALHGFETPADGEPRDCADDVADGSWPSPSDPPEEDGDTFGARLKTSDLAVLPETPTKTMSFAADDDEDDYAIDIVMPASKKVDRLNAVAWLIAKLDENLSKIEKKSKATKKAGKKTKKKEKRS